MGCMYVTAMRGSKKLFQGQGLIAAILLPRILLLIMANTC